MLYEEPNFIDARRILHRARQYTFPRQKLQRWIHLAVVFLRVFVYMLRIKSKHRELLSAMEELLNIDPNNPSILRLFAETTSGFGFFESAIFSLECIPEEKRNEEDWILMGESFIGANDYQMAVNIANKILAQSPENIRARDLLWQASVEQSMGQEKSAQA
jgi:predicted Zn-dependent protease